MRLRDVERGMKVRIKHSLSKWYLEHPDIYYRILEDGTRGVHPEDEIDFDQCMSWAMINLLYPENNGPLCEVIGFGNDCVKIRFTTPFGFDVHYVSARNLIPVRN